MRLNPIEIIALTFAILIIVKVVMLMISRKRWYKVAESLYSKPYVVLSILLILAGIVFYYILKWQSITQIFATMAFTSLIFGAGMILYGKDLLELTKKKFVRGFSISLWIEMILWLALAIFVIYKIFFLK